MVSILCALRHHADEVSGCAFSPRDLFRRQKPSVFYQTPDISERPFSPLSGHGYGGSLLLLQRVRLSCSTDGSTVSWWPRCCCTRPAVPLRACAVAPDSALLLAGASDGTVALWDFPCKTLRRCSAGSEASVVACCFSPCSQMFVTGCSHGDLKLWDTSIELLHAEKDAHDLGVTCCSFAPQFKV